MDDRLKISFEAALSEYSKDIMETDGRPERFVLAMMKFYKNAMAFAEKRLLERIGKCEWCHYAGNVTCIHPDFEDTLEGSADERKHCAGWQYKEEPCKK